MDRSIDVTEIKEAQATKRLNKRVFPDGSEWEDHRIRAEEHKRAKQTLHSYAEDYPLSYASAVSSTLKRFKAIYNSNRSR